jgi:hypothetical protein
MARYATVTVPRAELLLGSCRVLEMMLLLHQDSRHFLARQERRLWAHPVRHARNQSILQVIRILDISFLVKWEKQHLLAQLQIIMGIKVNLFNISRVCDLRSL